MRKKGRFGSFINNRDLRQIIDITLIEETAFEQLAVSGSEIFRADTVGRNADFLVADANGGACRVGRRGCHNIRQFCNFIGVTQIECRDLGCSQIAKSSAGTDIERIGAKIADPLENLLL